MMLNANLKLTTVMLIIKILLYSVYFLGNHITHNLTFHN